MMQLTPSPSRLNTHKLALLGGLCFFLSAIEYMIPKPLPFLRLGLANLPLLLALDIMPFSSFVLLALIKIIGQALISGTLFSYIFLFSLGGTGVSALLMYALRKGLGKERISLIGISAAGAIASNGAQLIMAWFFIFGESIRYAAAPILALGIVTGTLLGVAAEWFIRRSRWYAGAANGGEIPAEADFARGWAIHPQAEIKLTEVAPAHENTRSGNAPRENVFTRFRKVREDFCQKNFSGGELAILGLCMMAALLLNPETTTRIIQLLFFWFLAWLSGKKNKPLITIAMMAGIIFFNLLVPYGELLFVIGPLQITSGALWGGIRRAVTLEGLFMISRCCVRQDLRLPGAFGQIIGQSFRVFSAMTEGKQLFNQQALNTDKKNWVRSLDGLLIGIDGGNTSEIASSAGNATDGGAKSVSSTVAENLSKPKNRRIGSRIILAVVAVLTWLPIIAN